MNIGDRLAHYEARGFGEADAPVAVLLEVALQGLSGAFPDTFVCFGGAALVLFFGSSRISADLDLLVNGDQIPAAADVVAALSAALNQATQILNLGKVECSVVLDGADHIKISVSAISGRLFTIDVTRISSTIHSEIAEQPLSIESVPTATATFVTRNWMLLQKLEAFLTRRVLKARDSFDIKVLLDSGAKLNDHLKAHLADGRASERLEDIEFLRDRIAAINSQKCELELRPILPEAVYEELHKTDFALLREAVSVALTDWLEG